MQRLINRRTGVMLLVVILALGLIVACGDEEEPESPTGAPTLRATEVAEEATATATVTPGGPTRTPSPTFPPTLTPAPPSPTQQPATPAPPTATPGPYVHVVRAGQTCSELAVFYRLSLPGGVAAIRELNGLNESCTLSEGQEVLVPYPTSTPTPFGLDQTATAVFQALPTRLRNATQYAIYTYCPGEGDTLTSIAIQHGTSNQRICELNSGPDGLDCRGCDFSESAVGYCPNPPLISDQTCLNVPGPTHTVTSTPTFTGDETATPTPTFLPPEVLSPPNGATVEDPVMLSWVLPGRTLEADERYLVTITDEGSGEVILLRETKSSSLILPQELRPAAGESRQLLWSVEVVVLQNDGLYKPVSGRSVGGRFVWQS
ncbi:MAG: LysM peptidoglycan-binding domain-containing protein [Chloroflexi bacterium]|nr:LysM peptidoglycan-binding domain-containing protein [Chloroflexota bacterium]